MPAHSQSNQKVCKFNVNLVSQPSPKEITRSDENNRLRSVLRQVETGSTPHEQLDFVVSFESFQVVRANTEAFVGLAVWRVRREKGKLSVVTLARMFWVEEALNLLSLL